MSGCLLHAPLLGTWPTTQACALIGNRTGNPLVHRPVLNPLSHTSQGSLFLFFIFVFSESVFFLLKYNVQGENLMNFHKLNTLV